MKTKQLLLSCLLMTGVTMAEINDTKIMEGTTVGFAHCYKPGAPVDMHYQSSKVEAGAFSNITVKLMTTQESGVMEVTVDLDEALESALSIQDQYDFTILPDENEYTMTFSVAAQQDGLYYIRLLAKVESGDGPRMRAFAIPVYVGDYEKARKPQVVMKALGGENISVSKAEETIEIIED